jgi:hypothetical protein
MLKPMPHGRERYGPNTEFRSIVRQMQIHACQGDVSLNVAKTYGRISDHVRVVVRDVRERGRDIEGIIKQWFGFVKPNFEKVSTS